jgi:hypothetical protein
VPYVNYYQTELPPSFSWDKALASQTDIYNYVLVDAEAIANLGSSDAAYNWALQLEARNVLLQSIQSGINIKSTIVLDESFSYDYTQLEPVPGFDEPWELVLYYWIVTPKPAGYDTHMLLTGHENEGTRGVGSISEQHGFSTMKGPGQHIWDFYPEQGLSHELFDLHLYTHEFAHLLNGWHTFDLTPPIDDVNEPGIMSYNLLEADSIPTFFHPRNQRIMTIEAIDPDFTKKNTEFERFGINGP